MKVEEGGTLHFYIYINNTIISTLTLFGNMQDIDRHVVKNLLA